MAAILFIFVTILSSFNQLTPVGCWSHQQPNPTDQVSGNFSLEDEDRVVMMHMQVFEVKEQMQPVEKNPEN